MSPTLTIDTVSDDGAWQRAIDRGCLANADHDRPHNSQQGSAQGEGAGESGFVQHHGKGD
jgi:hypothetical protein